jgi:hypothetical protein
MFSEIYSSSSASSPPVSSSSSPSSPPPRFPFSTFYSMPSSPPFYCFPYVAQKPVWSKSCYVTCFEIFFRYLVGPLGRGSDCHKASIYTR